MKLSGSKFFLKGEMKLVFPSVTGLSYLSTGLFLILTQTIGFTQQTMSSTNNVDYKQQTR